MQLPPSVIDLLGQALGVRPRDAPPVALEQVRLPNRVLEPAVLAALTEVVGDEHVHTGAADRVRHTRGKSTTDLLRIRTGEADDAPDAVVLPGSVAEVLAVLRVCSARRVAVVPFGGGTSVVGGLAPATAGYAGVVVLDLRRLDRLVVVDAISRTATLEAGLPAPQAEALLAEHGFTLGHFPQSYEYATIGGFAATRSSGQASAGYGRFDEMVVGLQVATPEGLLELGRAPRSAAGPDLRQLFLGSEGTLGVITAVTVQVRPVPKGRVYEGWRLPTFADGIAVLRGLAQDGPLPTVLRLSDEAETAVNLARPDQVGAATPGGCLLIAGFEGVDVDGRREQVAAMLRDAGGTLLGPEVGQGWEHGRFHAPYLRDALLDAGALAETLETATFWSRLPELYDAVRAALTTTLTNAGTPPLVLCHVSHVYAAGASLYFTVVSAQADDPVAQWRLAKQAASAAIGAERATITHHHAVGTDHRAGYADEVGPLGLGMLRAAKECLDPAGILNPGILLG